ncbi:hypothetical protein ACFWWC_18890, partial [Streptomyces sp. NPDC058642]|uniref:hypothetical protein n=1 Tax=Streptomyces sp. NPDC058642 TaxID=3346572 RepID=UPI00364C07E6
MIAMVVTIGLAFVSYVVTYLNGLRLSQRQEHLARVNRQLSDFYGPLFALTEANNRTFGAFLERHARPGGTSPFVHEPPPTPEELTEWRLWVTTVFLPNRSRPREWCIDGHSVISSLRLCGEFGGQGGLFV